MGEKGLEQEFHNKWNANDSKQWDIVVFSSERHKFQSLAMLSVGEDLQQLELSYNVGGNVNWGKIFRKCLPPPNKLNMNTPYNPAISLLDAYPR